MTIYTCWGFTHILKACRNHIERRHVQGNESACLNSTQFLCSNRCNFSTRNRHHVYFLMAKSRSTVAFRMTDPHHISADLTAPTRSHLRSANSPRVQKLQVTSSSHNAIHGPRVHPRPCAESCSIVQLRRAAHRRPETD